MTILTSFSAWTVRRRAQPRADAAARSVVMHVTLDARDAASLRHTLSCDCESDAWTMRIAPLPGSAQVRLSLYVPRAQIESAILCVESRAPAASIQQIIELPHAPTDAWRDLARVRASEWWLRQRHTSAPPSVSIEPTESIRELITRDRIVIGLEVADQPALFSWIGARFAEETTVDAAAIEAALHEREQSGSTALGNGFAIPHCRLAQLQRPAAMYLRFAKPLKLDTPDAEPLIDAVVLLVPSWARSAHLALLADAAQRFCDAGFRDRLRQCTSVDAALACLRRAD
jgi:PTS system nitrogen regulatory IIA component